MRRYELDLYRSQDGRHLLHNLYRRHLLKLEVPISERMITTRFGDTHLVFYGNPKGKPVLFFYGENGINPLAVQPFAKGLDLSKIQLVVPDPHGCVGFSSGRRLSPEKNEYGEWASLLIDALDLPNISVMGFSRGGSIALNLCATSLLRVERLLLVVPSGVLSTSALKIAKLVPPSAKKQKEPTLEEVEKSFKPILNYPHEDLIEAFQLLFSHSRIDIKSISKCRKKELEKLNSPVFLVAEKADYLFPGVEVTQRARKIIPNLEGVRLLSTGCHFGLHNEEYSEDVSECFKAMSDFLLKKNKPELIQSNKKY